MKVIARTVSAILALGLLLAGCGGGGARGFYPAIDCQGAVIAADFQARCRPYRSGLRN
jgi:hypothetical protein